MWQLPGLSIFSLLGNRFLQTDQEVFARFSGLAGKSIRVEVSDLNLILPFEITPQGFKACDADHPSDAVIKGHACDLLAVSHALSNAKPIALDKLTIEGDIELVQDLQNVFQSLEIDWEERLSTVIGDVAAHKVGNIFRTAYYYQQDTFSTIQKNLSEYLTEELAIFSPSEEIEDHHSDVSEFRNDVERLAARITMLMNIE